MGVGAKPAVRYCIGMVGHQKGCVARSTLSRQLQESALRIGFPGSGGYRYSAYQPGGWRFTEKAC